MDFMICELYLNEKKNLTVVLLGEHYILKLFYSTKSSGPGVGP